MKGGSVVFAEALDKQIELKEFWLSKQGQLLLEYIHKEVDGHPELAKTNTSWFGPALAGAECYYWSNNILDIIIEASNNIPRHWRFMPHVFPTACGFFWLEKAITVSDTGLKIRAFSWVLMKGTDEGRYLIEQPPYASLSHLSHKDIIAVSVYIEEKSVSRLPVPIAFNIIPIESSIDDIARATEDPNYIKFSKTTIFASMLAFLEQKIFVPHRERAPRATFKRAERAGMGSTINIIKLRHLTKRFKKSEETAVNWSCQWIVTGHWRDQWYSSCNYHQPKWIASYLKGPEDKPLRNSERLFAVVR